MWQKLQNYVAEPQTFPPREWPRKIFVPREEGNGRERYLCPGKKVLLETVPILAWRAFLGTESGCREDICSQEREFSRRRYPSEGKLHFWAQKVAVEKIFVPTEEGFAGDGTHLKESCVSGHKRWL